MPPENEQEVSLVEKWIPITVIVDPARPDGGLSVIDGPFVRLLEV